MALHVDVVKNDWLAGIQHPVASIKFRDGRLLIEAEHADRWHRVLEELGAGEAASEEDLLRELHTRLHGSHIFATEAHDEGACPFHERPVVYLHGAEASGSTAVPAAR
jgi:hypothetical protein